MKKINLILLFSILIFLTACSGKRQPSVKMQGAPHERYSYQITSTPTLIFHGALSNYHSEESIVKTTQDTGITNAVMRINVHADGKIKMIGNLPKNAKNPIIMVNYLNNIQPNYSKSERYAINVIEALKQKYGITKINMIGHSLGNMSILYYLVKQSHDKNLPQVQKAILIAAPTNGVAYNNLPPDLTLPKGTKIINGKPSKMNPSYRYLTQLCKANLKNLQVLNIVGNTAKDSDGVVPNASSLSSQYLFEKAGSYRNVLMHGYYADHGRLTFSPQVKKEIISFLWP